MPELDAVLRQVEAGVEALVREAVGAGAPEAAVRLVTALADVSVWQSLKRLAAPPAEFRRTVVRLLACAIAVDRAGSGPPGRDQNRLTFPFAGGFVATGILWESYAIPTPIAGG